METGTLKELNVQPGDIVVHCGGDFEGNFTCLKIVPQGVFKGQWEMTSAEYGCGIFDHLDGDQWRIISRASEAPTGPVRTVTRKELVYGKYGRVNLSPSITCVSDVCIELRDGSAFSASELRAAIATLTEIADALEGQ